MAGDVERTAAKGKSSPMGMFLFGLFRSQKIMFRVVLATAPAILGGVYFFGWRAVAVIAVSVIAGSIAEWLFCRARGEPVSSAVFVSAVLLALTLPPTAPYSVVIIGIVIGIVFGKETFGGFGRNVFNPALVGRCFIYICFPTPMTAAFARPYAGFPGGFAHWAWAGGVDAMTSATPLHVFRDSGATGTLWKLIVGNVGGSIGETSAILILIGAVYLVATRTANWRIMVACLAGAAATSAAFHYAGAARVPDPLFTLFAGGLMFGAVFMATDPVSAAGTGEGRIIFGLGIGFLTVVIRAFSNFIGGVMFAILFMNIFNSIIDHYVREIKNWCKARAKERAPAAGKAEAS